MSNLETEPAPPKIAPPETLAGLIEAYRTDPDSDYHRVRYATRNTYDSSLKRLATENGAMRLADLTLRDVLRWHEGWSQGGKVSRAHQLVVMLRTLMTFGATLLEDAQCARMKVSLRKKFEMPQPRSVHLTSEHVQAIIEHSHYIGLHSCALAQAFQFEFMLRQKDVIGEWVPLKEPGDSYFVRGDMKWLRGLRWEEIDDNLILRHVTSKRLKEIQVDLRLAPLVMVELGRLRDRPTEGPIIRYEMTGRPYKAHQFRREWRAIADYVGVPKDIRNMDTRAGAITEATDSGADLEHIRQAATHSDISTTLRYSRNAANKVMTVQQARAAFRRDGPQTTKDFAPLDRNRTLPKGS